MFKGTRSASLPSRPGPARYALAIGTVAVAVVLRFALEQVTGDETPFLLLFASVLASAGFGGLGPGLLATLLGAVASSFFFEPPQMGFSLPNLSSAVRLLLFLVEGLFISLLGARLQAARQRAEQSESEASRLEQKILDISDDERRRIGQDLHDGLGQHLTGVAFLSKALQQRLALESRPEAADATKIASLVSESIGQTRALAKGLAPVGLEDAGLAGSLTQLAAATSGVFGIECICNAAETIEGPDLGTATHLYRIAQEAVNNAIRHGRAKRIAIGLSSQSGTLRLVIDDNGRGLDPGPRSGAAAEGMGLQIMRFRAKMIGGSLAVEPRSAGGTVVTCTVPLAAS